MANAVFDTLVAIGEDGGPVPYLAESIEPVDGDLTLWRLRLRPDIVFHDGTPLDAAAVKVNFDTQFASPLVGRALQPFFAAEGAITVVDDLTVDYRVLDPDAAFPNQLTTQLGMMASPTWLAAVAEEPTLNQAPVGTGPFVFDAREEDLADEIRPQRRMVGRRGVPRCRGVPPGSRPVHAQRAGVQRRRADDPDGRSIVGGRRSSMTKSSSRCSTRPVKRTSSC